MKHKRFGTKVVGGVAAAALVVGMVAVAQSAGAAIIPTPQPLPTNSSHLVAWYRMVDDTALMTGGSTVIDSSGNGLNGTFMYGPPDSVDSTNGLCFNDDYGDWLDRYIKLPDNLVTGIHSITVSVDVLEDNADPGHNAFIYGFGNATSDPSTDLVTGGNGYMYMLATPTYHAGISLSTWQNEQQVGGSAPLSFSTTPGNPSAGPWQQLTYTYDAASQIATLYRNGYVVAQTSHVTISPADLGGGTTTRNSIGLPFFPNDAAFSGCMKDFRIYNTALTSSSIDTITADASAANADAAALTVQDLNDVRGNLYLPTVLADGGTVTWSSSNPSIIDNTGVVNRQSTNRSVTLTATVSVGDALAQQQFTANVVAAPPPLAAYAGYLFAYFTDDSSGGQSIHMAISNGNNILSYTPLNGGRPVIVSHFGSGGLRDPSIVRSPDGDTFYLIATDLDITQFPDWPTAAAHGSQYIEVWKSHNLVDWTQQAHTLISLPTAGNTWAPDAIWDSTLGSYVVYWSAQNFPQNDPGHTSSQHNVIMYSTTRDFVNFSTPQVWDDPGQDRIDAAVVSDSGQYYLFTKADPPTGAQGSCQHQDILEEDANSLLTLNTPQSLGWTTLEACIAQGAGTGGLEGPIVVKSNPGDVNNAGGPSAWYMFADQSTGVGYIPFTTASISNPSWRMVTTPYQLPVPHSGTSSVTTRHGGILPITAAEIQQLHNGPSAEPTTADGKILQYDFAETDGNTVEDVTGHGLNGTLMGGATISGGALNLNGTSGYVLMPNNLLAHATQVTVDADVWVNPAQASPYMIWAIGNTDTTGNSDTAGDVAAGSGDGYLFATGDSQYRTAITTSDWTHEMSASSGSALPRGQWVRITMTESCWLGCIIMEYVNGYPVGGVNSVAGPNVWQIGNGWTLDNYLGRSVYTSDNYFSGKIKSFTIWNTALNADQVAALGAP